MKKFNKVTGRKGEEEARRYLEKEGLELVEQNWGNRWGEIDLIMRDPTECERGVPAGGEVLVMVEVKAKKGRKYGAPWEMVTRRKLAQVRRMGEVYVQEIGWQGRVRIDVVGVVFEGERVAEIRWWKGVGS